MARTAAETRSLLLEVAGELFYFRGIRATGVDLVAAEAGVAPTALYRLFGSKDGLVAAYAQDADHNGRQRWSAAIAAAGPDPREQILAMFDAVGAHVGSARFRGCPMLMALAEFPDPDLPVHQIAVAGKVWIRERLRGLADQLDVDDPAGVADQLTLVMEGLLASGQALGPDGPARQARHLAEQIVSSTMARSQRS